MKVEQSATINTSPKKCPSIYLPDMVNKQTSMLKIPSFTNLDPDFPRFRRGNLNVFDHQGLLGLPGNSSLAFDDLWAKRKET